VVIFLASSSQHPFAVTNFPDSFLSFDIAAREYEDAPTIPQIQENRNTGQRSESCIADLRKKWFSTAEEETKNAECSVVAAVGLISSLRRHPS
jgi:hypothetical protein